MSWHDSVGLTASRICWDDRAGAQLWPDGKRMAVLIYTSPEQWNWGTLEPYQAPGAAPAGNVVWPISSRSAIEYGYTVGLRRLREIYNSLGLKITWWTNGTCEQHPDVVAMLAADGHEIGAHGYSEGSPLPTLDIAGQRESIERTVSLITDVTGAAPKGWIGPAADATDDTLRLLMDSGIEYDADLQDDEIPYFLHHDHRTLTVIPYRKVGNINDLGIFTRNVRDPSSGIELLKDRFNAYYRAAETHQLYFNYGTHPHVSGRPDYAYVMAKFLEYVLSHDDVWVCTYNEVNQWWRQRFLAQVPPGGGDFQP